MKEGEGSENGSGEAVVTSKAAVLIPKEAKEEMPWFLQDQQEVITEEQARKDVLHWLKSKNLSMRKRHERASYIETIVTAIQEGDFVYNRETHVLTQSLRVPIKDMSEVTYPHREHVSSFTRMYKKHDIPADDGARRIAATVAVLTGKSMAEITKVQQDDYDLMGAMAVFFM